MRLFAVSAIFLALMTAATSATARRTAIDQVGDTPIHYQLGGYCDLNGDECGPGDGVALNYDVKIGIGEASNRVYTHGNGLVSFGGSIDFFASPQNDYRSFQEIINAGEMPSTASYGINLISAGQNNEVDYQSGSAFMQSSRIGLGAFGIIRVEWFTCISPTSSTTCPPRYQQFLTLTPGKSGFTGMLTGGFIGADVPGYVVDGVYTPVTFGTSFLIPAQITGVEFSPAVPEPASWALMIVGFGLVGAAMRRRGAGRHPQRFLVADKRPA